MNNISTMSMADIFLSGAKEEFESKLRDELQKTADRVIQEECIKLAQRVSFTMEHDAFVDRIIIGLRVAK